MCKQSEGFTQVAFSQFLSASKFGLGHQEKVKISFANTQIEGGTKNFSERRCEMNVPNESADENPRLSLVKNLDRTLLLSGDFSPSKSVPQQSEPLIH